MLLRSRMIAGGFMLIGLPVFAIAQEEGAKENTKATSPVALTPEEISGAARIDLLSVPTPGELLAALEKVGKPDWSQQFRAPIATNFSSRAQMALNLGGLIADGYIAVQAENAQAVKNVGRDIMALAKPLGVKEEIINRGKSLTDFADQKQWDVLKEELEAAQNEVKDKLADNKDQDLICLVTLGGWLRGTEVLSGWVAGHYSEPRARL
ncbi:MAG: hypothetical protein M3463_22230, partial [Verrucomicrobiota bacterium]|nr:hypothetical protein [Verrucomicrobiota bacterium]